MSPFCTVSLRKAYSEILVENRRLYQAPPLFGAHIWMTPSFPTSLASENPWAIVRHCLRDLTFSHFGTVLACDRQTDGWTHDDSIDHIIIATCGKNMSLCNSRRS